MMTTGGGRMSTVGRGCWVVLAGGMGTGARPGNVLMRAVSFFGPAWLVDGGRGSAIRGTGTAVCGSEPGGFGKGCKRGETTADLGERTGGRRGEIVTGTAAESEAGDGVILGGTRRTGAAGVREGRTILTASSLTALADGGVLSGRDGRAIRTDSLFGSVMGGTYLPENGTENCALSLAKLVAQAPHAPIRKRTRPVPTPADRSRDCR